jgi:hypothetical protein
MIILGILSVIQVVFLPGYIVTTIFFYGSIIRRLIISVFLSFLFNYLFVLIFTLLGAYTRFSVISLFITEIVVVVILYKKGVLFSNNKLTKQNMVTFEEDIGDTPKTLPFKYVLLSLALFSLFSYVKIAVIRNPGIFNNWDDLVSWHRWAVDWYNNSLPLVTFYYPQLIPANWSITYQFIGSSEIHFFAHATMAVFPILILTMMLDMAYRHKSIVYLLSVSVTAYLLHRILGPYIAIGYVDIPVSAFAYSVFYVLRDIPDSREYSFQKYILAALLVAGCTVTKQAGLFMLPFYAVTLLFYSIKHSAHVSKKALAATLAITLLITGAWYGYKNVQIRLGLDESELQWVTHDIYHGNEIEDRFITSSIKILDAITEPNNHNISRTAYLVSILILLLLSLRDVYILYIVLFIVVPFYITWSLYFSYDVRNIALAVPYFGLVISHGIIQCLILSKRGADYCVKYVRQKRVLFFVLCLFIIVLFGKYLYLKYPDQKIIAEQTRLLPELNSISDLNHKLIGLIDEYKLQGKILTEFDPLQFMPRIGKHCIKTNFRFDRFDSLERLMKFIRDAKSNNIRYLLFRPQCADPKLKAYVNNELKDGRLIFLKEITYNYRENEPFSFYEIK